MGGAAFKNFKTSRIERRFISDTVKHIVDQLDINNLTYDYVMSSLMGSSNKKETSGDLDIALNNENINLIGIEQYPRFDIRKVWKAASEVLPIEQINAKQLKATQLFTAWPIAGNPDLGFIQVDFIEGPKDWLQFTHYTHEFDTEFKGIFRSMLLGVIAKCTCEYVEFDNETRTRKVNLGLDLEHGLYRMFRMLDKQNVFRKVDQDVFETNTPNAPRFNRLNFVSNVRCVLDLLFDSSVSEEDINTFEKLVKVVKSFDKFDLNETKERFVKNLSSSKVDFNQDKVSSMF